MQVFTSLLDQCYIWMKKGKDFNLKTTSSIMLLGVLLEIKLME